VGRSLVKPRKSRFLAIPKGRLLTPSGRPRRRGGKRIQVKDAVNQVFRGRGATRLVRRTGGAFLVAWRDERRLGRPARTGRGVRKRRGAKPRIRVRQEIVGVLVRQAKVEPRLDFFQSWERLERKRTARYRSLLKDVVRGRVRS
jgi:hypothetical protein